ncbi:PAP2 superfamily protein [compost metagenome]
MPLIGTPPFPSYFSENASFTSATSILLADYFGESYAFTDNQKIDDGFSPRSFTSFNSMADEAAISRVYGGIHYQFDSEIGKSGGLAIANKVLELKY